MSLGTNIGGYQHTQVKGLANSTWPMFKHDLNHTGLSPYDTSSNNGILKWKFQTGGNVYSSPAIGSDGTIYAGSNGPQPVPEFPSPQIPLLGIVAILHLSAVLCMHK